jgi:hypothetical protein
MRCRWVNRVANFDNILVAILTLFQISTTELWVNTMYDSVAAVGIHQQPRDGHNPALAAFFVVFMIFGCFFVLQLFIATALEQVRLCAGYRFALPCCTPAAFE